MTPEEIRTAAAAFTRRAYKELGGDATCGTQAIRAAVEAVDTWIDGNAASYNAALPEPFKSTATAAQKSLLLAYVAMKKYGVI